LELARDVRFLQSSQQSKDRLDASGKTAAMAISAAQEATTKLSSF
jgi:hypothetical protein